MNLKRGILFFFLTVVVSALGFEWVEERKERKQELSWIKHEKHSRHSLDATKRYILPLKEERN